LIHRKEFGSHKDHEGTKAVTKSDHEEQRSWVGAEGLDFNPSNTIF
jgi:hypothetical protein